MAGSEVPFQMGTRNSVEACFATIYLPRNHALSGTLPRFLRYRRPCANV